MAGEAGGPVAGAAGAGGGQGGAGIPQDSDATPATVDEILCLHQAQGNIGCGKYWFAYAGWAMFS